MEKTLLPAKVVGADSVEDDQSIRRQIVGDGAETDTRGMTANELNSSTCDTAAVAEDEEEANEQQLVADQKQDGQIVNDAKNSTSILFEEKLPHDNQRRIATLSSTTHFSSEKSWNTSHVLQVDGEEKKVFIPVKRHASAVGPTKVIMPFLIIMLLFDLIDIRSQPYYINPSGNSS